MIKLKNFENYSFCPLKCEIYSTHDGGCVLTPLQKYKKDKTYVLYRYGVPHIVKFFEILRDNLPEIEKFLSEKSENVSNIS